VAEKPGILMATTRRSWTREELLILLNLYEKISFGLYHQGNPVLIDQGKEDHTNALTPAPPFPSAKAPTAARAA
jgi:hypothetical protein